MSVRLHVDSALRLLEADLPDGLVPIIEHELTFINPRWEQVENYGRWKNTQPQYLHFFTRQNGVLILPRGFISRLRTLLKGHPHALVDRTRSLETVELPFAAELYPYQTHAVQSLMAHRFGVLEAPPGAGKTVMALKIIACRRQPTLVVVHTKELMYQWLERASHFTGLEASSIGLIGDGQSRIGERLTIGIINSLAKCASELKHHIGHLVVDECHHLPARTFSETLSVFDSAFMLGLSATPYRRDGLSRLIHLYLGELRHRISPRELQDMARIMRAQLLVRRTDFTYAFRPEDYQGLMSALCADESRNALIADDVAQRASCGRGIVLVISERVAHCRVLNALILQRGVASRLLTGDIPMPERAAIVAELSSGTVPVVVATSRLIGEGFDLKDLSSIFLATPVKFTGRVKQYIGRILRVAEDKEEALIYDYVDALPVLRRSFQSRLRAYDDLGVRPLMR